MQLIDHSNEQMNPSSLAARLVTPVTGDRFISAVDPDIQLIVEHVLPEVGGPVFAVALDAGQSETSDGTLLYADEWIALVEHFDLRPAGEPKTSENQATASQSVRLN